MPAGGLNQSFFHHVDSEVRTQAVRLGGKHLYLLTHLTGPTHYF